MDQIHSVIASFKDQLSSAFGDYERARPNRPRVLMMGRPRSWQRERNRTAGNKMPPLLRTKLDQLVNLVNDVSRDMCHSAAPSFDDDDDDDDDDDEEDEEETAVTNAVCLKGPPGSEPRINLPPGVATPHSSKKESLVHRRNSTNIALRPFLSPGKLKLIPMKDNPPSKCEVFLAPPKEVCGTLRYTRSKERACRGSSGRISYREESSSDEEEHPPSTRDFTVDTPRLPPTSTPAALVSERRPWCREHSPSGSVNDDSTPSASPHITASSPIRKDSLLLEMTTSESLYESATESPSSPDGEHKSAVSDERCGGSPYSSTTRRTTLSPQAKVAELISHQSPLSSSSPIARETPSLASSLDSNGEEREENQPMEFIGESPLLILSPSLHSDRGEVGEEEAVELALSPRPSSSPSPTIDYQEVKSDEYEKKKSPHRRHSISDSSSHSNNMSAPCQTSLVNSLYDGFVSSKTFKKELSPSEASGILTVLDDIQKSFKQNAAKKGKSSKGLLKKSKRELRSRKKAKDSSGEQLLPAPSLQVEVKKLSLDEVKSLIEQRREKGRAVQPLQPKSEEGHDPGSWIEHAEEVVHTTEPEEPTSPSCELPEEPTSPSCELPEEPTSPSCRASCEEYKESGVEVAKNIVDDSEQDSVSDSNSPVFLSRPPKSTLSLTRSKVSHGSSSRSSVSSSHEYSQSSRQPVRTPPAGRRPGGVLSMSKVDSEDEFDMNSSRLYLKVTPLRTPASTEKRKKVLRSYSDDEDNSKMYFKPHSSPVIKTEISLNKSHNNSQTRAETASRSNELRPSDSPADIEKLSKKGTKKVRLPRFIPCAACGKRLNWKRKPLDKHPRMDVLVCEKCLSLITSGEFTIREGYEEYCSLCGDGGEILVCASCIKSFCTTCVERVSGTDVCNKLLEDDDEAFTCYYCDPSPLVDSRQLFRDYQSLHSSTGEVRRAKKSLRNDSKPKSTAATNSRRSKFVPVKKVLKSDKNKQASPPKNFKNTFLGGEDSRESSNSVFTCDSSLSDGESPVVNTDDVSLSDSSIFEQTYREGKKTKSRTELKRCRESGSNSSSEKTNRSNKKYNASSNENKIKKKKRKLLTDFDLELELEIEVPKKSCAKSVRKRLFSLGPLSDESSLNTTRTKKSKLAIMLSSNSESEDGTKLTAENTNENHSLFLSSPDGKSSRPLAYLTPQSKIVVSSDSSDTEPQTVAQKPRKKRKVKKLPSIGSLSDGSSSEGTGFNKKNYDTGDEFDLSRVGPRLKKKNVRKLDILSDSDFSNSDSSKKGSQSEEGDGSGEEKKQSTPGKKRKDIRKLIEDSKLDEKTKLAVQREKERLDRLKKKRTQSLSEEEKLLVLEEDTQSKKPLMAIRSTITPFIKPHQKEGIQFLYDACVESLERFKSGQRNGAILAHCMGLGKTLQLLAFVDALLSSEESGVGRVLILTPVNTLYNWRNEFEKWLPIQNYEYRVYLMNVTSAAKRLDRLRKWFNHGGIMFMGYQMFRNMASGKSKRGKERTRADLTKYLLDPGADIVVCDEGHLMRNSKSGLSLILGRVKTTCRIILTGTPLQNNLMEYYTMVNFVKPNLLGTQREFVNRFVNPIKNGQCSDSKPSDIRTMKQRAHILHQMVEGCVQRKDFRVLSEALPPKHEYVISFHLTEIQDKLYRLYLEQFRCQGAKDLFSTFANLSKIWNHPWLLRMHEERNRLNALSDEGSSLDGFIVSESDEEVGKKKKKRKKRCGLPTSSTISRETSRSSSNSVEPIVISSDSDFSLKEFPAPPQSLVKLETGAGSAASLGLSEVTTISGAPALSDQPGPSGILTDPTLMPEAKKFSNWYDKLLTDDVQTKLEASGKLLFLMELLDKADSQREKVIVFSQSLLTLNMIETFLQDHGDWTPGLDYYRLDGSTSADVRQSHMTEFNDVSNDRIRLFLISTRAGSLGVNLVAANRVVIFDACWNPSHDLQAIFRTYRFGQTKPVYVYRLLAQGTMEEKIYDRQVTKESLSRRVVDNKQIGRHYTASDLAELFTYSPKPPPPPPYKRPTDDRTFCSILDKLEPQCISCYHEHDSLLEHIYDEELTEDEKKAAWESYKEQTSVAAQQYNYEALQNKLTLEEAQQRPAELVAPGPVNASIPAFVPTAFPLAGVKAVTSPYDTALSLLDTCISQSKAIIRSSQKRAEILLNVERGLMRQEQANRLLSELRTIEERRIDAWQKLIGHTNEAILTFNRSFAAQITALNKKIRKKQEELQVLYSQVSQIIISSRQAALAQVPDTSATVSSTT